MKDLCKKNVIPCLIPVLSAFAFTGVSGVANLFQYWYICLGLVILQVLFHFAFKYQFVRDIFIGGKMKMTFYLIVVLPFLGTLFASLFAA